MSKGPHPYQEQYFGFTHESLSRALQNVISNQHESLRIDVRPWNSIVDTLINSPSDLHIHATEKNADKTILSTHEGAPIAMHYLTYGEQGRKDVELSLVEEPSVTMTVQHHGRLPKSPEEFFPSVKIRISGHSEHNIQVIQNHRNRLLQSIAPGSEIYSLATNPLTSDVWGSIYNEMQRHITGTLEEIMLRNTTISLGQVWIDPEASMGKQIRTTSFSNIMISQYADTIVTKTGSMYGRVPENELEITSTALAFMLARAKDSLRNASTRR